MANSIPEEMKYRIIETSKGIFVEQTIYFGLRWVPISKHDYYRFNLYAGYAKRNEYIDPFPSVEEAQVYIAIKTKEHQKDEEAKKYRVIK